MTQREQELAELDHLFTVLGSAWYDGDSDTFTNVPPNVTLGEN